MMKEITGFSISIMMEADKTSFNLTLANPCEAFGGI
jgi:hypothetical protein